MNWRKRSEVEPENSSSRRPFRLDQPLMQEHHAGRDVARKAHLVGHDQHRAALLGERAHDAQHFADQLGIERRGRLVEQHHLRPHGERARDRRALLLASGEMGGIVAPFVGDADFREQRARFLDAFRARALLHMHRRLDQVLQHRQMRPQVEALEHHAEFGADAVDLAPVGRLGAAVARAGAS